MKATDALIIIAKSPDKESVKTRMKDVIPDDMRLRLYESLLESTVQKLKSIPSVDTCIAFAPAHSEGYFSRFGLSLIPLPPGDLGAGMYYAFQEVFQKGYSRAALVGADIPDLSGSIIHKAFELLYQHDIVFGPARDGGYYLIGMRGLVREVFEDVPWSSEETLQQSIVKAQLHGYGVAFTDTLSDIDTLEDLTMTGFEIPERPAPILKKKTDNHRGRRVTSYHQHNRKDVFLGRLCALLPAECRKAVREKLSDIITLSHNETVILIR